MKRFPEEISIRSGRLRKADCCFKRSWVWFNSLRIWIEQKGRGRETSPLPPSPSLPLGLTDEHRHHLLLPLDWNLYRHPSWVLACRQSASTASWVAWVNSAASTSTSRLPSLLPTAFLTPVNTAYSEGGQCLYHPSPVSASFCEISHDNNYIFLRQSITKYISLLIHNLLWFTHLPIYLKLCILWICPYIISFGIQFSSIQLFSRVWLFVTAWVAAHQVSLSITNSRSLLKLTPTESVMPSSRLILCRPLLLLPPIPPSIRVVLPMRWPKYWSFSFSISPSNEHPGLICFRTDWLDLPAVQGTHKSLVQHHSSKALIFLVLSFLDSPTLTSIHDHWKNHSLD